jgi:hypothetical protein
MRKNSMIVRKREISLALTLQIGNGGKNTLHMRRN